MYLHELVPYEGLDLIVANDETGHIMVLTSQGAVFQSEDTDNLLNLSVSFGLLITSDKWRIAKTHEVQELRAHDPDDYMMELQWRTPTQNPKVVQLHPVPDLLDLPPL